MAYDACQDLYYVCVVQKSMNLLSLGVVRRYANPQLSGAFRPVLGNEDLQAIEQYINQRTSAFVDVDVVNLPQQEVKISLNVSVSTQTNQNQLAQQINQRLRLYLSPWINSSCVQMPIEQGINRNALIEFLTSQSEVLVVNSLAISTLDVRGNWVENTQDPMMTTVSPAIFISTENHMIEFNPHVENVIATNQPRMQSELYHVH